MIKHGRILWMFYRRILIPAVLFSLLTLFIGSSFNIYAFGTSILIMMPFMHYFMYEVRFANEYFFYSNLGFSRKMLWISTIVISTLVKLITGML